MADQISRVSALRQGIRDVQQKSADFFLDS